jgi:hypothetical protein
MFEKILPCVTARRRRYSHLFSSDNFHIKGANSLEKIWMLKKYLFQRKNRLYLLLRIRPQKNPADEGFAIVICKYGIQVKDDIQNLRF